MLHLWIIANVQALKEDQGQKPKEGLVVKKKPKQRKKKLWLCFSPQNKSAVNLNFKSV